MPFAPHFLVYTLSVMLTLTSCRSGHQGSLPPWVILGGAVAAAERQRLGRAKCLIGLGMATLALRDQKAVVSQSRRFLIQTKKATCRLS